MEVLGMNAKTPVPVEALESFLDGYLCQIYLHLLSKTCMQNHQQMVTQCHSKAASQTSQGCLLLKRLQNKRKLICTFAGLVQFGG